MDLYALALLGTAGAASLAGIIAPALDRFRKTAAGAFALAGGVAPWLFFVSQQDGMPGSTPLLVAGIFGSSPLFLLAFFLYGAGQPSPNRGLAAAVSLAGMFAGLGYSAFLVGALAVMGQAG